jgi:hypothetical protein
MYNGNHRADAARVQLLHFIFFFGISFFFGDSLRSARETAP